MMMKRSGTYVVLVLVLFIGGAARAEEPAIQPKSWDQCTPAELAGIGRQLRKAGDQEQQSYGEFLAHAEKRYLAGIQSRQLDWPDWLPLLIEVSQTCPAEFRERFVSDIETSLLTDKPAARSIAPVLWRAVVARVSQAFPPARKVQWVQLLRGVYLDDQEGLAVLTECQDVEGISAALALLGDQQADGIAALFAEKSGAWQFWSSADLERLIGKFPAATKIALVDGMLTRLLEFRRIGGGMSAENWQRVTVLVRPGLPAELSSRLGDGLRKAFFGKTGGFEALDARAYGQLTHAMRVLGATDTAELPVDFVLENNVWKTWDPNGLASLVAAIGKSKGEKAGAACGHVFEHIQAGYLADDKAIKRFSCEQWKIIAKSLGADAPEDARSAWAEKLRLAFAGDKNAVSTLCKQEVSDLADAMRALGSQKAGMVVLSWMSSQPQSQ